MLYGIRNNPVAPDGISSGKERDFVKLIHWAAFSVGLVLFLLASLTVQLAAPPSSLEGLLREEPSAAGILGEQPQSVDVLVLGDSEAYSAISPMELWKEMGYTAYVCATCGQPLCDTEQLLYQAFENQSPKVVLLETNALYRRVSLRKLALTWLENCVSTADTEDGTQTGTAELVSGTSGDSWKGFRYNTKVRAGKGTAYMRPTQETALVSVQSQSYLERIAAFCQEQGAELILLSTPSTVNWSYPRHNGVQALADALGLRYVDLNLPEEGLQIDWSTDTRDRGDHLNYFGAVKVTDCLGEYLSSLDCLTDHRGDAQFDSWARTLEWYEAQTE